MRSTDDAQPAALAWLREPPDSLKRILFVLGIALLLARCAWAWWPGFNPPSLWLDDEWVAVLVRSAPGSLLVEGKLPIAPGFVFALRATTAVLGRGEWQLQTLSVLAALSAVVLLSVVVSRLTHSRGLGLAAGAMLAANPVLAVYSVRVKQFSLDGLFTLGLFALALLGLRSGNVRVFLWLAGLAAVLPCFSFVMVLPAVILVNLTGYFMLRDPACRETRARRSLLLAWAAFDLAVVILYHCLMRGRGNPSLFQFWSAGFPSTGDPIAVVTYLS
ncbi:MAG: hypothetical protein L0170_05345, partial [Acidobacteria bacterium]|nr:hypothetical protein [Acidobacteriota bacterium]